MKRLAIRPAAVMLMICCFTVSAGLGREGEPLAEEVARNLEERLPGLLSQASVTGAAVAVVDGRNIVWEQVYGNTGSPDARPVDAATIFSIQSMSKSFTALAVMMAVQERSVDLDSPINRYIPGFTVKSIYDEDPGEIITLRHLLSHHSGLTHEAPFGSNWDDRNDFGRHIESISETWLRYPVGYRYAYSNLGIDLAGYILQEISGRPFESCAGEMVFDALGMSGSSFDMVSIEQVENRAIGRAGNGGPVPLRVPMIPAGGVYTNIRDMAKFLRFHINGGVEEERRILRESLLEEMHEIQYARPDQRFGYCLGLIREPVSDSYCVYHAGGGYGFESIMVIYPEKKLGFILLTNTEGADVIWQARDLVRETIVRRYGETPVQEPGIERMTELEPDNQRIRAVMGRYGDENIYTIGFEEGVMGITTGSGDFYPVTFHDDNGELAGMFGSFSEVRFMPCISDRNGPMMLIDRRLSNPDFNTVDFNDSSADPPGPAEPHWAEYTGEYELLKNGDPVASFDVTVRNGYLYADECRCRELDRGIFFTYDGQVIDFSSDPQSALSIQIRKKIAR